MKRHCTIRRDVGTSEREREVAGYIKSEVEFVDVVDTLKRAISELMRFQTAPVFRLIEGTQLSFRETMNRTKGSESPEHTLKMKNRNKQTIE